MVVCVNLTYLYTGCVAVSRYLYTGFVAVSLT